MTIYEGVDQWVNFFIGWVLWTGVIGAYVTNDNSVIIGLKKIFVVTNEGVLLAGAIYIAEVTGISPLDILDSPYLFPPIFVTLLIYSAISAPLTSILIVTLGMTDTVLDINTGEPVMVSGRDRLVLTGAFVGSIVCVVFTWIIGGPLNFWQGVGYVVVLWLSAFTLSYILLGLKKLGLSFIG